MMSLTSLTVELSTLFNSIRVPALVLGAIVYLGYTFWPTIREHLQLCQQATWTDIPSRSSPCGQAPREGHPLLRQIIPQSGPRRLAAGGAFLALFIGLALSAHNKFTGQSDVTCPLDIEDVAPSATISPASGGPLSDAQRWRAGPQGAEVQDSALKVKLRSPGAWKISKQLQAARSQAMASTAELPSELLARAHTAVDESSGHSTAWPLLEACAAWGSPSESRPPLSELFAQLKCNGELLESGATTHEAAPGLLSRARHIMEVLRAEESLDTATLQTAQVEWARITHGAFQLSCKAVADELRSVRNAKASTADQQAQRASPLSLLRSLKRLEGPFQEALTSLAKGSKALEPLNGANATEEFKELQKALGEDRSCALQALQEGRNVALALPRNAALVKRAVQCRPRMLEDFQALVLKEAAEAKDAATLFSLGIYYSDAGLAAEQGQVRAPFFGEGSQPASRWKSEPEWEADAGGSHAPSDIVKAESLMKAGEEASEEAERSDRGAARALRLYQHAKMLALKHHDSAAEWRYRTAAELAATYRRQKLASHALGRLGYFLSLRGRREEALEAAGSALQQGEEDSLAVYLHASLRRSLGELKTSEEVEAAEKQLGAVAGKLPSKALEDQRAVAHTELGWWRLVATEGLHVCLKAWDAAQMLICVFSGLVFKLPGAGPQ